MALPHATWSFFSNSGPSTHEGQAPPSHRRRHAVSALTSASQRPSSAAAAALRRRPTSPFATA
eukprot:SAG11_NODE_30376_length_301_cov_1.524752_1_plen_62_part_10